MNQSPQPESPRSPAKPGEQEAHAVEAKEPLKLHGDALLDGSGNRHGVHEPEQPPSTCI